jgi:hypothetical protein|nr:MAG TPA: hypothetical protein [Caudoviricetes sp.]
MPELFDIGALLRAESPAESRAGKSTAAIERFEAVHTEKIHGLKQLLGRLPKPGEIFFLWTLNSFNAFTFIAYTVKHCGVIDELLFSTYSLNERILNALIRSHDRQEIKQIYICISDSVKSRIPKVNDQLNAYAKTRNIKIGYAWNHSKVTLMKTGKHRFVVCGSGNFSENALNEQYIFLDNPVIFDFYADCLRNRID